MGPSSGTNGQAPTGLVPDDPPVPYTPRRVLTLRLARLAGILVPSGVVARVAATRPLGFDGA